MKVSTSVSWGIILILAGILFLLDNLGVINVNLWGIFWPMAIIWFGINILWGYFSRGTRGSEHAVVPLDGARRARLHIRHGAGRLHLAAGAGMEVLAEGDFGGGVEVDTRKEDDLLDVELKMPNLASPGRWASVDNLDWTVSLNPSVPLSLDLATGAGESELDLTDLALSDLRLRSGASETEIRLPAHAGYTRVDIATGAAEVRLIVPTGVAASILARGGLASIQVDQNRFPRQGDYFQSPDYDAAPNRVEIRVETGVGELQIR